MSEAEFRARHDIWKDRLCGSDPSAVFRQLPHMVWNMAVWRSINEARRHAPLSGEGGVALNGPMHRLIDECFFATQATTVRRLALDGSPITGNRGVASLRAILNDMCSNRHLLSRRNLLTLDRTSRRPPNDPEASPTDTADLAIGDYLAEQRHEELDALCGVACTVRSADDLVAEAVFDACIRRLDESEPLQRFVDQFIAHSATEESRRYRGSNELNLTWESLWKSIETLCKIANFLDVQLVTRTSHMFLPTPQFDQFSFVDRPLISLQDLPKLHDAWKAVDVETSRWSGANLAWILGG